jgi:hypothetical protein
VFLQIRIKPLDTKKLSRVCVVRIIDGPARHKLEAIPADEKGYTDGMAWELNQKDWALRGGWFLEPQDRKSTRP